MTACVVDTGNKFLPGVNDTGDKFIAGDNDTGDNLLPVTTTPVNNYCRWQEQGHHGGGGAAKDRRKLKVTNRWYLRPPKSATAADGVVGTAMKSCIQRHPTHPHQRPRRSPILNIAVLFWSSFGGLRGLLSRCAECLWMQLFKAVPMTPLAAVSDFGGRRYRRFVPICRKLS